MHVSDLDCALNQPPNSSLTVENNLLGVPSTVMTLSFEVYRKNQEGAIMPNVAGFPYEDLTRS